MLLYIVMYLQNRILYNNENEPQLQAMIWVKLGNILLTENKSSLFSKIKLNNTLLSLKTEVKHTGIFNKNNRPLGANTDEEHKARCILQLNK